MLGLPEPGNSHAGGCSFEFPVKVAVAPGRFTALGRAHRDGERFSI